MDLVVPVTVEPITFQTDPSELLIVYFGPSRVDAIIDFGMDLQTLGGSRSGDEVDDHLEADERLAPPVLTDEAEEPMLDLVPLAGAGREVTYGDPQAGFVGQLLEFNFPQSQTWSIAASGICRDQQSTCLWIHGPSH